MAARKKSGFTLIELLVVIAIIAILAAILFPVFARAREAARKSTCQSNMKECAIALQTYWNDYDATLPSSLNSDSAFSTWSSANFVKFSSIMYQLPPPTTSCPISWPQKLYNSMKNKDIMFCPSDSVDKSATATDTIQTSYWWKYAIDRAWGDTTLNLKCQKEGQFGYNADQIVFYERAGFHTGQSAGLRNGVQINVAFLDSHVRSVSLVNSAAQETATPVSTADAGGEPNYFNFDNENANMTTYPPNTVTASYVDPARYSDKLP